jgi:hypothetical protein
MAFSPNLIQAAAMDFQTLDRLRHSQSHSGAGAAARGDDAEIARIRGSGVRERFLQITDAARALLYNFRAVEQNFRDLDRAVRERIEGGKGALLDEVLGDRDAISDSDQGKSFRAF